LGHLALAINAVDYESRIQGNVPFDKPVNPPTVPAHKDKATEAEIAKDNRQHKALCLKFLLWHNVDTLLRNLLIATVPGIFITANENPVTGFRNNVTCLELITHLHGNYGKITEQELEENVTSRRSQWNPPTYIESQFVQIEDGVSFAAEGNNEPTKPTVLSWANDIVAKRAATTSLDENGASLTQPKRTEQKSSCISRLQTGTCASKKQLAPPATT
jgi:hypothetical protein